MEPDIHKRCMEKQNILKVAFKKQCKCVDRTELAKIMLLRGVT